MTTQNTDYVLAPGTIGRNGIDLSRISIWKEDNEWVAWIPPTGPESYENGDPEGAYIDHFGNYYGKSFDEVADFVRLVLQRAQNDRSETKK